MVSPTPPAHSQFCDLEEGTILLVYPLNNGHIATSYFIRCIYIESLSSPLNYPTLALGIYSMAHKYMWNGRK